MTATAGARLDWDVRRGDTLEVALAADGLREFVGRAADVADHGWYRDVAMLVGGIVVRFRVYRDGEHQAAIGRTAVCRVLKRRDRRARCRYNLD